MPSTLMTAKSSLVAAIAALSIVAVPATPALALGDKEKGFVIGVATAVIAEELIKRSRLARTVPQTPQVVYVDRPTVSTSNSATTSYDTSIYRTPAARAFNSYSVSERRAIQRNLRAWGYYRGGIDGVFGPGTYSAISAYATDEGASGKLDSTTGAFAVYDGLIF
jgi:Putative peptidoglycan binding domain